ncbi:MAG: hypothetical protein APR54_07250 [Candidatus Cloacimonas sp. SDB]|nr:MAG: hypothetical protein APR54_07250 [Candidatus Cloacimonas sp. SDB]
MKKFLFPVIILVLFSKLFSAEVTFDSYVDKTKVSMNDYVRLSLEFTGEDVGNIRTPGVKEIQNFRNMGSSSSSSSSISIVNGKMEKSVTKTFTYNLKPLKSGNLLIPPLIIQVNDQKFTTDPIRINVTQTEQQNGARESKSLTGNGSDKLADNMFLVAEINKNNVYRDEPVVVDYVLYTRYEISNLSYANEPVFNGFWKENIYLADRFNFKRTTYRNMSFNSMLMRSVALYPSKTGKLEIPSLEVLVDIRTQSTSFFDFGSTKRYEIKSKPLTITVKDLPAEGRPADFSGAVGNYSVKSSISSQELKVGESFTYTLEINGTGNLNHFDLPELTEIKNFRFLDPEITTQINDDQVSGKKVIKYLVIAQEVGTFTIPSLSFSYFDTQNQKYVVRKTQPYQLTVQEGNNIYIPSSSAQSVVSLEGTDIGFIIRNTELSTSPIYFNSFLYWFLIFIITLSLPIVYLYYLKQKQLFSDKDYIRQKQASKILKKYLKEASRKFKFKDPEFYSDVHIGLSNYLTDKIKINRGSSTNLILEKLRSKVSEESLTEIQSLFLKCSQVRFMPGGFSQDDLEADYQLLKKVISELSRTKF